MSTARKHKLLHHNRLSQFFQSTAWPHYISGQVLSSRSIVSSSRTVRLCSMWRSMERTLEDNNGQRFDLRCHTHKPQKEPHPICVNRSGNVRHRCGGDWAGPTLFFAGPFQEGGTEIKVRSLVVLSNFPRFIGDPPKARHFCYCRQMNWWVVVEQVQTDVSIWDAVHSHSMGKWAMSRADFQAPQHGVLDTVWLLCDEAQQVGCLRAEPALSRCNRCSCIGPRAMVFGQIIHFC